MKNKDIAKWWSLAAVLMFAAATFQIVSERFLLGVICFGAAACFLSASAKYRKREAKENQHNGEKRASHEQ